MNMANKYNNGIDFVSNKLYRILHIKQFYLHLQLRVDFIILKNFYLKKKIFLEEESIDIIEKISSPIIKDEPLNLPTIVLARPLVDNFKLLRTLECR
jgi:hypothetical protein